MKKSLILLAVVGLAGCSHVPFFSGKNYYKMVETRVGNQRVGQNAVETREVFCPANRLSEKDDPSSWSDQELFQHLRDKDCLRIICHTDQFSGNKCTSAGDDSFKAELLRMRGERMTTQP